MFALLRHAARRSPAASALRSPSEQVAWTFGELEARTLGFAGNMHLLGVREGDIVLCDLGNVADNMVIQLACSRLGASFGSAKDEAGFRKVAEEITSKGSKAFAVGETPLLASVVDQSRFAPLEQVAEAGASAVKDLENRESLDATLPDERFAEDHAFFNSLKPLRSSELEEQARDAANQLGLEPSDAACVSITLCHAFGAASAIGSCLHARSAVVLPGVAGTTGCGKPSDRAKATAKLLEVEKCTILFCDTHTLKAMKPLVGPLEHLRGGVCKIGSGTDFLQETVDFAGVDLRTLGKRG